MAKPRLSWQRQREIIRALRSDLFYLRRVTCLEEASEAVKRFIEANQTAANCEAEVKVLRTEIELLKELLRQAVVNKRDPHWVQMSRDLIGMKGEK